MESRDRSCDAEKEGSIETVLVWNGKRKEVRTICEEVVLNGRSLKSDLEAGSLGGEFETNSL